jgi:hypothetical protein
MIRFGSSRGKAARKQNGDAREQDQLSWRLAGD